MFRQCDLTDNACIDEEDSHKMDQHILVIIIIIIIIIIIASRRKYIIKYEIKTVLKTII